MSFPVVLERNRDGRWTVSCPFLPGCISQGRTRDEAMHNIRDAIRLYLASVRRELATRKRKGRQVAAVAA